MTERIKDGEKLVRACYTVAVYAPLDALDEAEQAVRAIYRGQGWRVNAERYVQLPSWLGCLPMASAGGLDADRRGRGRARLAGRPGDRDGHGYRLRGAGPRARQLLPPGRADAALPLARRQCWQRRRRIGKAGCRGGLTCGAGRRDAATTRPGR